MEVQPITLARLVDQLVAAGLVERRADPSDRRANHIHLTAQAAPHLAAIERITARIRADALRSLDERQAEIVHSALQTMRDNLSSR
jgi:DNA-binding MarR family transcriptional regulator